MIEIKNANKFFNKGKKNQIHVINDTTLTLEDKGLVAILGNSGCGKTTLLNTIGGLDKLNKGEIKINGQRITKRSSSKIDDIRNMNIGYIFQNYELIDDMTVFDNVALVLKMIGVKDKKDIEKNVNYVLEIVGLYEYRNRLAAMLSGGERQRVGIARAIVKNPSIIIADEPTGNLDSKNSLEIMDIIKAISYDKLVILVTHEKNLAYFYATRIIELVDGKVVSDKDNSEDNDELDYRVDNKIYLKDIKTHKKLSSPVLDINFYSDGSEKADVTVIVKDGKLYIQSDGNKVDLVNDDSNIELVDDNYKKLTKEDYQKYSFDYEKLENKNKRLKYTSIYNPVTLLLNGFKKVFNYSLLKKILLFGFVLSSMFIMYAISNTLGILNIKDSSFVTINKNYLEVNTGKLNVDDFKAYEALEGVNYIIPGDSNVSFKVSYKDFYYQTYNASDYLQASLSSINMINKDDLIIGKMPESKKEVVVDKMALKKMMENQTAQQLGLSKEEDFLNRKISLNNLGELTIVGLTDLQSPSIYTYEEIMINAIVNSDYYEPNYSEDNSAEIIDYSLYKDKIKLKKGKWPKKDYEVIVNNLHKDEYKLNKKMSQKVNGKKLKVVGYYTSKDGYDYYLTNNNTVKYKAIASDKKMSIYANNKEAVMSYFKENNMNIKDSYTSSRDEYIKEQKKSILSALLIAGIILAISLAEIYLMLRSSFLSRIKEVGTLRAIGLKKKDVYKMFLGEILAITIITSLIGFTFMGYILKGLITVNIFKDMYIFDYRVIILSTVLVYIFNIFVGLLPVYITLRKTPAQILSRTDAQ